MTRTVAALRPIFALFLRSLRVETRSHGAYAIRTLMLITVLLTLWAAYESRRFIGAAGLNFFTGLNIINFVLVTLGAVAHFSSAITEEKEERTLGLLRMTSLSSVAILLGKSSSRIFSVLLLFLAQFPFTVLAVALGGVSLEQIVACAAILAAYLFSIANLGLLYSVICRRSRRAALLMMITIGVLLWPGPWLLQELVGELGRQGIVAEEGTLYAGAEAVVGWIIAANPFLRIGLILASTFAGGIIDLAVMLHTGAGVVFFLLAWVLFERSHVHEAPADEIVPLNWRQLIGRPRTSRRSGAAAFLWKDVRFIVGGPWGLAWRFGVYGLILGGITFLYHAEFRVPGDVGKMLWIFGWIAMPLELASAAARLFSSEIKAGALPTLAMLPCGWAAIIIQKVIAGAVGVLPALTIFVAGVALDPEDFFDAVGDLLDESPGVCFLIFLGFFPTFTAYLSLWVKRAPLVVAAAICFLMFILVGIFFGTFGQVDEDVVFGGLTLTMILALLYMVATTAPRLEALSAR